MLLQMEKLQITNPIIEKDCKNIYVFPFRFMLKLLLKVKYLDKEEMAYFLFKVRNEDELEVTAKEILNFRRLGKKERESLIAAFRKTHIGNITLVQAASSKYYISLCQCTGIVENVNILPDNREERIDALRIKEEYLSYVQDVAMEKYREAETFDFKNDLSLWIEYIGNPDRNYPPIAVTLVNPTNEDCLIQIFKDGVCVDDDLLNRYEESSYPMFVNEEYIIKVLNADSGAEISSVGITPDFRNRVFSLDYSAGVMEAEEESFYDLQARTMEHINAQNFDGRTLTRLNTLARVLGVDKTKDKALRGAFLEYYFFKILSLLENEGIIDGVVWNGKIGDYNLPLAAPGGKKGMPDMVFIIDDVHYVLELTTIKAKALQFQAEGSSVPDHIKLYSESHTCKVEGIFCAPIIHERNKKTMTTQLNDFGIKLHNLTCEELLNILSTRDRSKIKECLCAH